MPLLFGWRFDQWCKAIDYYNRVSGQEPVAPGLWYQAAHLDRDALQEFFKVRQFWASRRTDQPLDVVIEIAS
ncbi:hypothetical protein [Caldimonas brevitalea]|uniref:Uncharacterized protein n=1 Tax=Caldimonas brevitalea TaxID=413882 RepID=A0A0G3BQM2_9BURK|nr:hypothetical protein [Caldimonas brevitalea]AKJ28810.1 hypothetical protein AAW51_2119 [Caldimonas brevitalea]